MAHPPGARGRRPHLGRARTPDRDPGRSTGGARHSRPSSGFSIPIALKFTALIAVLVIAAMAWQAMTAIEKGGEHLETEINENGIAQALAVAGLIAPDSIRDVNIEEQKKLNDLLKNYSRNAKLLDIVVMNRQEEIVASVRGSTRRSVAAKRVPYSKADQDGVTISEFEDNRVPVRSFSANIADAGKVEILVSVKSIQNSHDDLSQSLTTVTIIASIGGAFAAFLLATFLTRPIRTLMRDLRKVSMGDLQHQSQVNSNDELGNLARIFNRMTMNLHTAQAAQLAQRALAHELSLATSIQSGLLPSGLPELPGFDLAAFYLSAKEVGGDYYDFLQVDGNTMGIVVADVSGKGVPGSLVMTMTRSLLHMAAKENLSPEKTVIEVNNCLAPDMNPGMFVTMAYLVLNTLDRKVRLVRAGHNAPLLYSARHGKVIDLHPKGIAIGLDREGPLFSSQLETQKFTLQPGDVLVLYTDGSVEGKDPHGNDFGDERLQRLIFETRDRSAQEILDTIMEDLRVHQESAEQSDDITLLVLKSC